MTERQQLREALLAVVLESAHQHPDDAVLFLDRVSAGAAVLDSLVAQCAPGTEAACVEQARPVIDAAIRAAIAEKHQLPRLTVAEIEASDRLR